MIFSVSVFNLINLIFIAAGIGICGLSLLQINASSHLRKEVRRYFQVFFSVIILYISDKGIMYFTIGRIILFQ